MHTNVPPKKKKKIKGAVSLCGFPISGNKKGGKSKWVLFLRSEERVNMK